MRSRCSFKAFAVATVMVSTSVAKPAFAQVWLEGSIDCGDWISARTATEAGYLEHYLLGLINGMAISSGIEFWHAGGVIVSREQAFLWIDRYCRDSPLSNPIAGAMALIEERTGKPWRGR